MKRITLFFSLIIRNIKWLFIKAKSKNNQVIKEIKGSKMVLLTNKKGLDVRDDSIFKQLALDGQREFEATKVIENIIKPGYKIFELGANIGYYALLESRLVGQGGKIFAVEPEQTNFQLLNKNIELNSVSNIETHNFAISDQSGEIPFYITENSNLHSMIKPKHGSYQTVLVKTQSVDTFLADKGQIDFIRMDIEGYEYYALKGMNNTLANNPNLHLFIELHSNLLQSDQSIEILRKLQSHNFEISTLISHDNFIRKTLGQTKVEILTIDQLCQDQRILQRQNAFEIFFKKKV